MPTSNESPAATDHYYQVFVGGYVFPKLAAGSTDAEIREAVEEYVGRGDLDVTQTTVEGEWDE